MFLSELKLTDFRNYREATLTAPSGVVFLAGENGAGKTNVLEAIHFLGLCRSFRTAQDRNLIREGADALAVAGRLESRVGEQLLELRYGAGPGKSAAVNGEAAARLVDYVGTLAVVAFTPEDLALVKGEPAGRRRFLDMWLGQESRDYLYVLQRYYEVLRGRNALLARGAARRELEPYDAELVAAAAGLTIRRAAAVGALAPQAAAAYEDLAPHESLAVEYLPAVGRASAGAADVAAAYERALAAAAGEDRRRRTTTVGPHRDDLALAVAGLNGRHFASEGQQRTAALALRVAQFRLLEKSYGETPLMLLDDVGSELDERRRARLAELLGEFGQTWLSGAVVPAAIRADAILRVSGGKISS